MPRKKTSKRLQEFYLVKNTYFGAIHNDIDLDMNLDYTIDIIFHERSLSELETLHHLWELKRTQKIESLALAKL